MNTSTLSLQTIWFFFVLLILRTRCMFFSCCWLQRRCARKGIWLYSLINFMKVGTRIFSHIFCLHSCTISWSIPISVYYMKRKELKLVCPFSIIALIVLYSTVLKKHTHTHTQEKNGVCCIWISSRRPHIFCVAWKHEYGLRACVMISTSIFLSAEQTHNEHKWIVGDGRGSHRGFPWTGSVSSSLPHQKLLNNS